MIVNFFRITKIALLCFIACYFSSSLHAQLQVPDYPIHNQREKDIQRAGDYIMKGLPLSAFVLTLIHKDLDGAKQMSLSFITNLLVTESVKDIINKDRPEGATDGRAFPSGHTSTAFNGAAFIQRRYGWKLGVPAYALASFVGYSRIESGRHDGFDVLAGMVVGIGSAYLFTKPKAREKYEFTYSSLDGTRQLGIKYKF